MRIDCDDCAFEGTSTCDDCVVTFLLRDDEAGALVLDLDTERALRALEEGGLAPATRYAPRTASS